MGAVRSAAYFPYGGKEGTEAGSLTKNLNVARGEHLRAFGLGEDHGCCDRTCDAKYLCFEFHRFVWVNSDLLVFFGQHH